MTWHVLHAGKFVGADGVVLDRAEHEFIAASEGLPESALRLIARSDPVPRQAPAAWQEGFHAAFVQATVKVDGADHTLRVIDHRAFEGPPGQPGRPYRRRTYLLQACDAWAGADAALPIDAMALVPSFQAMARVPPWQPRDAAVDKARLAGDLGSLMQGKLHLGDRPSAAATLRLSAVLACLPPAVASRIEVSIGGHGPVSIAEGTAGSAPAPDVGQAWLDVLRQRGARPTLASLAAAAALPWRHATPAVDLKRAWDAVRAPLGWAMQAEAWGWQTAAELAAGRPVPPPAIDAAPRALQVVLPALVEADAFDRIGVLAEPGWRAAWAAAQAPPSWAPVALLLAGKPLLDDDLAALAGMPLSGTGAAAAAAAWREALARVGDGALRAFMTARSAWAKQLREALRDPMVARALACLAKEPGLDVRHPLWRLREGQALEALLAGRATPEQEAILARVPAADLVACHGDVPANGAWLRITGNIGDPGDRPDAAGACLRILHARRVGDATGFAAAWQGIGRPLPVASALRLGVPYEEVAACLPSVDLQPADEAVARLLACPGLDPQAWLQVSGPGWPWSLLAAGRDHVPDARDVRVLATIVWHDVPTAAVNFRGELPSVWRGLPAGAVRDWLERGGTPARLDRLASTAPVAVLAALQDWMRNPQRPDPHARAMLERHLGRLSWNKRRAVRREAERLEAA